MKKSNDKDDWRVEGIVLEYQYCGKGKGKYLGSIKFSNREYESFKFNIDPKMADKLLSLISSEVVDCAENLGDRLIRSLGLDK